MHTANLNRKSPVLPLLGWPQFCNLIGGVDQGQCNNAKIGRKTCGGVQGYVFCNNQLVDSGEFCCKDCEGGARPITPYCLIEGGGDSAALSPECPDQVYEDVVRCFIFERRWFLVLEDPILAAYHPHALLRLLM
jgi:hypothetical protein